MKRKKIISLAAVFASLALFASCTVENGEYYYGSRDKNAVVVWEVQKTIEDYLMMATNGFAAMSYEQASDEDRIILETFLLKGYSFSKTGEKWVVETPGCDKYYVALEKDTEGKVNEITVTRPADPYRDGVPLFDTCLVRYESDRKWNIAVQACSRENGSEYNYGAGDFTVDIIKEEFSYPVSLETEGRGAFEVRKKYGEGKPLEIEWVIKKGKVDNYTWFSFEKWELDIKAGIQGEEKTPIEATLDGYERTINGEIM